ncbi:hypothetical protein CBER1_09082 [Cercospora berteroae]|uniref:NACHT domain-containing protein n=1 Tax=Cercospora berteroae TaxID=357750 RepID=A0A2S6C8W2_9PEZI|nr:hypothetical protein CBER1_09082 [Cercospora berteroae]
MRLLNVRTFQLAEFHDGNRPKYAIASHRWSNEEVTLRDVRERRDTDKIGYTKIVNFAKYVREHVPGVEWLWIDTCCIDKNSAAEHQYSINSMFRWYRDAVVCIAYLADVNEAGDMSAFVRSAWFTRGWTLQELLAPRLVVFVTATWQVVGNKGASTYADCGIPSGPGLEKIIYKITGIQMRVLHDYTASTDLSIDEKLRWMNQRCTTRREDESYALLGIFDVFLPVIYGEGDHARERLLAKIYRNLAPSQLQEMVKWLSPADPWANHRLARQVHEPGTGSWLLRSTSYQKWKSLSTGHLWLFGPPGCGKTILCSTAIEDIKAYCETQPNSAYGVFYLFFSDNRKQYLRDLLCSLIIQLGRTGRAFSMLEQAFHKLNRSVPGVDELENILLACLAPYDEVYLLIDALDECPEENNARYHIARCLLRLSMQAENLKILVTSRELPDIRAWMKDLKVTPLAIPTDSVNEDIRQYVGQQLSQDDRLSQLDHKTKELIVESLVNKADGMFKWAVGQLQELKKLNSTEHAFVVEALNSLSSIDDSIASQSDDSSSVYAESILSFATSASSASTLIGDAVSDDLVNDFVRCLFCNNDLLPLNLAAITDAAIGVEKFRKNLNRLIRHYGNDLKGETTSKDEVRVARVMRQGNVAIRAAQSILDITENVQQRHRYPGLVIVQGEVGSLAAESKVLQPISLQPFPEDEVDDDTSASEDDTSASEDEFEDPGLAQETFSDVKGAFLESRAYARFKERLLDFVNRPSQKRILKAIGSQAISSAGVPLNVTALKAVALELSFVSANAVTLSYGERLSCSDILKGLIETWMGESWDWSPLARRKYALKDKWCRVLWKTPSDGIDYVDLPLKAAGALWNTMQSAPNFVAIVGGPQRSRDCTGSEVAHADTASPLSAAPNLLRRMTSVRSQSKGVMVGKFAQLLHSTDFVLGLLGASVLVNSYFILWRPMPSFVPVLAVTGTVLSVTWCLKLADRFGLPATAIFSGHSIGSSSHFLHPVSHAAVPIIQIPQQTHGNPVPSTGAISGTSLSTSIPSPVAGVPPGSIAAPVSKPTGSQNTQTQYKQPEPRHVFLCVRNGTAYKFSNLETHVLRSDSEFFRRLKSEYLLLRGSFKRWFSWWQYDRCDFYQFSKYPMTGEDEAVPQHIGYPETTNAEYYYDPRPIDPCPPSGPISDQEFRNRFHKSCHRYYSWHLWHKRKLAGRLHGQQAIARLPKRDTALNMQDGKREIFWGLYARERRSFARVFAYGLLANTPSIVFFFLWLFRWGHASDLQNAAVPAGMSLSLTMLFMALLYESREIELR